MPIRRLTFTSCALILIAGPGLPLVVAQQAGEIATEKQSYETKAGDSIEYELGTLFVPENRSDPNSRVIGVGFARFPSVEPSPVAPPLIRLPGGPGSSYLTRLESLNGDQRELAFTDLARLSAFCDVVLVDQRGFSERGDVLRASASFPVVSPDKPRTLDDIVSAFKRFADETATQFAESAVDLSGYTVKECAHDVAELCQALGYDRITLNGTSFGSQWSFAVMRLHPDIVARALLSGVEPLNHGYDMPSDVLAAVQRMWRAIDQDPQFEPYLPEGGMAEAARIVIERLEQEPLRLEVKDRNTGQMKTIGTIGPADFPWNDPTRILELYHGHTDGIARTVALQAIVKRRKIALIGPLIDSSLGVTPERRYQLWNDPATRYLGRVNFAGYLESADIWPSADVGDEFRTPVTSEIPVVFAQGDWDTKMPIENTFEIAPFFVNSRVIIAERGGHGVFGPIAKQHPQVWDEVEEFLRTGDMEGIPARVRLDPARQFAPPKFPAPSG